MNDKNEEKAVVSQGKSNKKRRFRPRNKNKQENLDQNAQNGEQKASQSVIDNFFLEPFDGGEQPNANKQNGKKNRSKNNKQNSQNSAQSENKNANKQAANAENQTAEAKPKKQRKPKKNLPAKLNGNEQWQQDIAASMEANKAVHELRLEPMKYLNSTDHRIRITPLGGLGEIGGNMTIFETDTSAIIVDIGMSFPSESMHGVDILIPDFDYVRKIKDKIKGVVITHAHEDHIGAVPYFYKEFKFP
ncbi:MBL fold metallo-hydrolase, partial [Campylobacter showae]|uniref:MBL fold metallo-hydrolase n=1 Tax=Campylobacter showae TaxID=204 RepID=UPI0028D40F8B